MVRILTFGSIKIWLFIEQLHVYLNENNFIDTEEFVCYFKFSEPNVILFGELIRDPISNQPMVFKSIEGAEEFAAAYVAKRFRLER